MQFIVERCTFSHYQHSFTINIACLHNHRFVSTIVLLITAKKSWSKLWMGLSVHRGYGSANERKPHIVTPPLICLAHSQNDPSNKDWLIIQSNYLFSLWSSVILMNFSYIWKHCVWMPSNTNYSHTHTHIYVCILWVNIWFHLVWVVAYVLMDRSQLWIVNW